MDQRIVGHPRGGAAIEIVGREGAVQAGALDVHLDKENLRNGVEGAARVHLVHIAQDAVADEQEILEFFAVEGAQ